MSSKSKTKIPKVKTLDDKVREYIAKEAVILDNLGLKRRLIISFKHKGEPTFWQRFAIFLLSAKGGFLDIEFLEKQ